MPARLANSCGPHQGADRPRVAPIGTWIAVLRDHGFVAAFLNLCPRLRAVVRQLPTRKHHVDVGEQVLEDFTPLAQRSAADITLADLEDEDAAAG